MVKELNNSGTRKWIEGLVRNTFSVADADLILRIPLAEEAHDDVVARSGESFGDITVRSAYKLLQTNLPNTTPNNLQTIGQKYYKKFWNLDLPSKVKISMWRILHDFIPTRENLRKRRLIADAMCPVCENGIENLAHVFCWCPTAFGTWDQLGFRQQLQSRYRSRVEWLTEVFLNCSSKELRLFCSTVWVLWYERNRHIPGEKTRSKTKIARYVLEYLRLI